MNRKALIVDNDPLSIDTIVATLNDAEMAYELVSTATDAMKAMQTGDISVVFARGFGDNVRGADLCREIRKTKSAGEVLILVILTEDQLVGGAEALVAGANDLLIQPFEPREIRMRANIIPADQLRRVDQPHTLSHDASGEAIETGMFIPEFDSETMRFTFGEREGMQQQWEADPNSNRVALDKIIVCPCCEAVPTFRQGCGSCGSAWAEQEVLLHHYACAHVAPESEFSTPSGLICPKCRLTGLVAGSDFERTHGVNRCSDCHAIFTEAKMIGHCLNCQHRFVAADGVEKEVYGYDVRSAPGTAIIAAPNYQTTGAGNSVPVRSEDFVS